MPKIFQRILSPLLVLGVFVFTSIPVFAQTPASSNSPVISDLTVSNIIQSSVMISWNTDVPATTRLDYGSTASYEIASIIDSGLRTFHQIQVSPLDAGTTYHYRVRSTNASAMERVDTDRTFTTKPPLDYMPPEEIISLRVASATVTSLILTWNAPGDDGSKGTSTSYEIRASYRIIPEIGAVQWWNGADVLSGLPVPGGPGTKESYAAQNLATSTKYYFAVRSRDKAGNISPISIPDIISSTTLAAPPVAVVSIATSSVATSTLISASVHATSTATMTLGVRSPSPGGEAPLPVPSATSALPQTATLFTGNLSYGMRSESVKTLQRILIAKGFLSPGSDSGFFGSLTLAAVKKFQCSQKIVCSGLPRTTGYGLVGIKTRAKLGGM